MKEVVFVVLPSKKVMMAIRAFQEPSHTGPCTLWRVPLTLVQAFGGACQHQSRETRPAAFSYEARAVPCSALGPNFSAPIAATRTLFLHLYSCAG